MKPNLSKQTKRRNKIIYILLGNIAVIFVSFCMAAFSTCCAWFASNKKIETNGMKIKANSPGLTNFHCDLLPVLTIDEENNLYQYDSANHLQTFKLPTYDPGNIAYSEYEKAVVLDFNFDIEANKDIGSISLSVSCEDPCFDVHNDNSISNAISFIVAEEDATENTVNTTSYDEITFITSNVLSKTADGEGKRMKDTQILDIQTYDLPVMEETTKYHIYVVATYNNNAIQYITQEGIGTIVFSDDLTFEVVIC